MNVRRALDRLATRFPGGPRGNRNLTALLGAVLLAGILVELATLVLGLQQTLTVHIAVGVALIPIVLVKLASTGWRMIRYYTRSPAYRAEGPPRPFLRGLAPLVVGSTVALLGSGVGLVDRRPALPVLPRPCTRRASRSSSLVVGAHAVAHLPKLRRFAFADWASGRRAQGHALRRARRRVRARARRRASRSPPRRTPGPGSTRSSTASAADRRAPACARQDSNLRPRAPEARALSPELRARGAKSVASSSVEVSARIVTLELAETFVIARERERHGGRRPGRGHAQRRPRLRRGGARRPVRRVGAVGARVRRGTCRPARRRPVRARRDDGASAHASSSRRARRSTRRCTTCRGSSPGCRCGACSGSAAPGRRRAGRSGSATRTTWRAARRRSATASSA